MLRKERRLYPRHSLRRKRLPVRNANHPSDGHKLRNDRSVAVHFQVAFTQKPAGICVLFPGQSIRGSGVFYAAAWRVSRQWPKTPVRAPFASREKRRPLANRAFEAHALCGKRMSDAPYGNQASKPVLASPSRRLAGIPIGGRWEQNPAQRLSRRRLQPPVLLERRFCEKRMPDALYGNQASKSILASPSRRLTENPTGGRWEQNLVQSLVAATSPTVRSIGMLFLRKADVQCAIRKSSVEVYLGVSFPAADREPDRRTLGTESGSEPCRSNVSDRPFFWSAVSAKSGCPMRYTEIKRRSLSWSLLPGGWPRTRQGRRTLGTESGAAPYRGDVSNRSFFWSAVPAENGCPVRYTEIKRRSLSWRLLPGGWPV